MSLQDDCAFLLLAVVHLEATPVEHGIAGPAAAASDLTRILGSGNASRPAASRRVRKCRLQLKVVPAIGRLGASRTLCSHAKEAKKYASPWQKSKSREERIALLPTPTPTPQSPFCSAYVSLVSLFPPLEPSQRSGYTTFSRPLNTEGERVERATV